jgi:hypothetical protein
MGFSFNCSASPGFSGQDGGVEQDLMVKVVVVFRCGHLLLLLQFDVEVVFINPDLHEAPVYPIYTFPHLLRMPCMPANFRPRLFVKSWKRLETFWVGSLMRLVSTLL